MMTSEKPDVKPDGRYTFAEAARRLGVCTKTLRRYEADGRLRVFVRPATRNRVITGRELLRVWNTIK